MLEADGEREARVNWLCGRPVARKGSVNMLRAFIKVGERGGMAMFCVEVILGSAGLD